MLTLIFGLAETYANPGPTLNCKDRQGNFLELSYYTSLAGVLVLKNQLSGESDEYKIDLGEIIKGDFNRTDNLFTILESTPSLHGQFIFDNTVTRNFSKLVNVAFEGGKNGWTRRVYVSLDCNLSSVRMSK